MARSTVSGPEFVGHFAPLLRALNDLGGSARPAEACDRVAADLGVSDAERAVTTGKGGRRFDNQVAWARFYLAKAGYIGTAGRGVWTLTSVGRKHLKLSHEQALSLFRSIQEDFQGRAGQGIEPPPGDKQSDQVTSDASDDATEYRAQALSRLLALSPSGFERFCAALLRAAGFVNVQVMGRTGDQGIDGSGLVVLNGLTTFRVVFQCKRYKGSVGAPEVQGFGRALQGKGDRGLIITTGSFTAAASAEAVRDGASPIDLVDGAKLIEMMERHKVGLRRTFEVDTKLFAEFG